MSKFNERIKQLRIDKKLTQKEMANILLITERAYQYYEATRDPNVETLIRIADCFDISTDYLLGRTDNPNSHKQHNKGDL